MCVLCVLSCVVSGGDLEIVLTTHCADLMYLSGVLVNVLLLSLQASDPQAFGLQFPGEGVHLTLGECK